MAILSSGVVLITEFYEKHFGQQLPTLWLTSWTGMLVGLVGVCSTFLFRVMFIKKKKKSAQYDVRCTVPNSPESHSGVRR